MAKLGEQFYTDSIGHRAHPSRIMEGAMHDSRRYRDSAAECLLAAQEASQPHGRKFHLSMAISWLSLARQYEAIERLFQGTGEVALIKGT